ncbi:hypothetical protein SNE40_002466 [Patella caerulea]|uniref:Chitin-binding type-2 domain-containing protein n=1 Tax=Patella caerulea TaxID=87958 RepID=A0AAN8K8M0_PATCE
MAIFWFKIYIVVLVISEVSSHLVTDWATYCGGKIGLFRHPELCDRYIACSPSHLYIGMCPEGLHFNYKHNVCDWPYKADCKIQKQSNNCPDLIICKNHVKYFQFPDWSDCSKFYVCTYGVLKKNSCPMGMHYDFINWTCTFASTSTCYEP